MNPAAVDLVGWGTLLIGIGTVGTLLWTIAQQRQINRHSRELKEKK